MNTQAFLGSTVSRHLQAFRRRINVIFLQVDTTQCNDGLNVAGVDFQNFLVEGFGGLFVAHKPGKFCLPKDHRSRGIFLTCNESGESGGSRFVFRCLNVDIGDAYDPAFVTRVDLQQTLPRLLGTIEIPPKRST